MKKIFLGLVTSFTLLFSTAKAHAAPTVDEVIGKINTPPAAENLTLSSFLNNIITILFAVGGIAVLFMLIFAALQWITSGGEKEAVAKARGRITWALAGLALLALSFLILRVIGDVLGFQIFT